MKVGLKLPPMRGLSKQEREMLGHNFGLTVGDSRGAGQGAGQTGQAHIILKPHYMVLRENARRLAVKMKENHIREEVIDTMVHESLHAAITEGFPTGMTPLQKRIEEKLVETITKDIMDDIRTTRQIPFAGTIEYVQRDYRVNPPLERFGVTGYYNIPIDRKLQARRRRK
jgi:hypothetical protein